MARHYLDHASTSPLRPEARDAVIGALDAGLGDPGRIHQEGMAARAVIEHARDQVAGLLGARSREVVFTSGATEAIATAVWGAAERGPHQIVPAIEHSAVRLAAERSGPVTTVPVDQFGRVDTEAVLGAIGPDTALVHIQWGNHEVGTLSAVAEIVAGCRARGVLVHVDAAQAAGHLPISFRDLDADLLSVSAHKLGGPPGIGALLVRRGVRLRALLLGGDQERARRAGLENLPAIIGFGAAAAALAEPVDAAGTSRQAAETAHSMRLTNRVLEARDALGDLQAFGHPTERLPHLVCLGVPGVEPQAVLLDLDRAGIAAHSGSSCASEALEPSPVLAAMGVDAHRSLRISTGWNTTDTDIDALLAALPGIVARLRALAGG